MQEFEKWYKEVNHVDEVNHYDAEAAWKAALKWVMTQGMNYYGNDFLTDMSELSGDIRKELGDD